MKSAELHSFHRMKHPILHTLNRITLSPTQPRLKGLVAETEGARRIVRSSDVGAIQMLPLSVATQTARHSAAKALLPADVCQPTDDFRRPLRSTRIRLQSNAK
jgi:hypothetical protein